jgi:hypothetical protein
MHEVDQRIIGFSKSHSGDLVGSNAKNLLHLGGAWAIVVPLGSVKVWDWMWDFDFAVLITNWKIRDMFHWLVPRGGIEPPTP